MRIAAISIFAVSLCGCQNTDNLLSANGDHSAITGKTAEVIAEDMASRLAEQLSPTGRSFVVVGERSDFGIALQGALKSRGLMVALDKGRGRNQPPTEVAYSIIDLDGQIVVRVSMPEAAISRSYTALRQSAVPSSPLSVIRFN